MSLKEIARQLRRQQTDEEKALWRALRGRRFAGFKFRRQHLVGSHILDFYCADAKLAVELDGSQHGQPEGIQHDAARKSFLAEQGIETLRFWNHQWHKNHEGCLLEIWNAVQQRSGWVRVMMNAGEQKFIPPEVKEIKFLENNNPSPRPSPRLAGRGRNPRVLTYAETIQFLYGLQIFGANFGLENTLRFAERAGNPQNGLRFIHVAGTNGKGSTCAMLESIYRAAGLRVGLFTSPHLVSFRERIQIDRQLIPESDVVRIVAELRASVAGQEVQPTLFEFATVMALKFFAEHACDLVIWETGLGGRLDATNIVTPLASVITNIALDHTQWLGETLELIAAEKAGIIKTGIPVVTAVEEPAALAVIERIAWEKNAPLTRVQNSELRIENSELSLLGDHQKTNAALAVAIVEVLQRQIPVSEKQIRDGLQNVKWAGRLQLIEKSDGRKILLDGAHNVDGAKVLRAALPQFLPLSVKRRDEKEKKITLIIGVLADKDWREMCNVLAPVAAKIFTVPVASPRTTDVHELAEFFRAANASAEVLACKNLSEALNASKDKLFVVIAGSLYLIGEALEQLGLSPDGRNERGLNEWTAKGRPENKA